MGMSINLTLLVQIVHFMLAYVIITRLFLRPGYAAVKSDLNRVRQLRNRIVARQELIAHKQTYKRTRWELFQDYFYKQKPEISKELLVSYPQKEIMYKPLTQEELSSLSDEISTAIKKKVLS